MCYIKIDLNSSSSRPPVESFGLVMNQLVTDLSGQDNLNQLCSELTLLPPLCHHDDLPLVGPTLHDTDHRYIEEQVTKLY